MPKRTITVQAPPERPPKKPPRKRSRKQPAKQSKPQPPLGAAWTVAKHFAPMITKALLSIRPVEALLLRRQAAVIAHLFENKRYQKGGTGSFDGFVDLYLKISPSLARQRRHLDEMLEAFPEVEKAFLDGRLTVCKVLAIKKALEQEPNKVKKWIECARRLDVRRLQHLIREKFPKTPDREPTSVIAFYAPPMVHSIFEEVVELGRMQLGYNAPLRHIIEALLMETGYAGLAGDLPEEEPKTPRKPSVPVLEGSPRLPQKAVVRLTKTLAELVEYLKEIEAACLPSGPRDFDAALAQYDHLRSLERRLRVFKGRLLRDMREIRGHVVLRHCGMGDYVVQHLGISERAARDMVADAEMFEDAPSLMEAYTSGKIGLAKAHRIKHLTHGFGGAADIQRASEVTGRYYDREYRFRLRLRQCFPKLAHRFQGPLPQPGLQEALVRELGKEGIGEEEIEKELHRRKIEPIGEECSLDPAENPVVMRQLEALLDMLIQEYWEDPPEPDEPKTGCRQTFAGRLKPVLIRIRVPREVAADWRAAIDRIKRRLGPGALDWHAAMALFAHVIQEWSQVDPKTKPRFFKIHTRDRYQCQAPACPKRGDLHGHHMNPRSRGGGNEKENLTTVCSSDHQDVIHKGHARVSGSAPQALRWELGCGGGRKPMLILLGEKIVGGTRAGGPPPCDVRRIFGT